MAKRITVRATIAAGDVATVVAGLMGVSVDYVTLEVADYDTTTTNTSRGWTAERRAAQSKRIKALHRARKREAEKNKK